MFSNSFFIIVIVMVFLMYGEKVKWIMVNFSFCNVFGLSFKLDFVKMIISVMFCRVVDYFLLICWVMLIFGIFLRINFIISIFNRGGKVFFDSFFVKKLFKVVRIIMLKILKILFFGKSFCLRIDYNIV